MKVKYFVRHLQQYTILHRTYELTPTQVGKSSLNLAETLVVTPNQPPSSTAPDSPPPSSSSLAPTMGPAQGTLAALTAEDLFNSNSHPSLSPRPPTPAGLLALDGLPRPSRSSARQALGVTVVRQPGRRGPGDLVLEPLLHLQVVQPSALISCHHRKQRMEVSVFDVALHGVNSHYKCLGEWTSGICVCVCMCVSVSLSLHLSFSSSICVSVSFSLGLSLSLFLFLFLALSFSFLSCSLSLFVFLSLSLHLSFLIALCRSLSLSLALLRSLSCALSLALSLLL